MFFQTLNRSPQPHQSTALFTQPLLSCHATLVCVAQKNTNNKQWTRGTWHVTYFRMYINGSSTLSPMSFFPTLILPQLQQQCLETLSQPSTTNKVSFFIVSAQILTLGNCYYWHNMRLVVLVSTPFALPENGLDRSITDICSGAHGPSHYILYPNIPLGKRNGEHHSSDWGPYLDKVQSTALFGTSKLDAYL